MPLLSLIAGPAYHVQQASIRYGLLGAHLGLRLLSRPERQPDAASLRALQDQYWALLAADLRNVEQGMYPPSLLFQLPLLTYAKALPHFLLDLPRVYRRFERGDHRDVPEDVDPRRFPAYFRRNFHWQTDGYLSERSAGLYDLSVEFLFMGCADVMRRQVIPPMSRLALKKRTRPLRILEVGCGTGRTLRQIATALPEQRYFGVDLSPYYLESARQLLADVPEVTLVAENAEELPFRDGYFDMVSSVYLFHELPRKTRRRVILEMFRVLRPGGLLVLEDSAQLTEASDLEFFLEIFAAQMHEPFYRDYMRDDLEKLAADAGFRVCGTQRAWLSKVVHAERPRSASRS
jgi:ubiquinone/menaquinone biosynthesis C-methylase UbiE